MNIEHLIQIFDILISWPVVILILGMLLLFRHREAINERIKYIKFAGKHGVAFYPPGPFDSKTGRITEDEKKFIDKDEEKELAKTKDIVRETGVALVDCRIASSLPRTVAFDFLKDWKVWFWIFNREPKKYRAYIKIKFITDGYKKELDKGYYGGGKAWNLNAFSGIQAPGLAIPDEIKKAANQRKKIKIEINCTVKDENNKLVEKKLPNVYRYEYEKKYWYLEP